MLTFRERVLERMHRTLKLAKNCKNFVSDGLTGVPDFNLYDCGVAHDWSYHVHHGTNEKLRAKADKEFRECMIAHNHPFIARLYWIGVRLFGWVGFYFDLRGKHKAWCHEHKEHEDGC